MDETRTIAAEGAETARLPGSASAGAAIRGFEAPRQEWLSRAAGAALPLLATLELTKGCNLRCYHCYVDPELGDELGVDRWVGLVHELADLGGALVTLTGGELATFDGWLDIARAVRKRHMMLGLLTNGTLFTDDDLSEIARLRPVRVGVSLYGTDADAHDRVTMVAGSFERTMHVVGELRRQGVPCRISTVLMEGVDSTTVAGLAALADQLGCDFSCSHTVFPGSAGSTDVTGYRVGDDAFRDWVEAGLDSYLKGQHDAVADVAADARRSITNCRAGMTSVFIDAFGDVFACMGWNPPLGSIARDSLTSVWSGKAAREHRTRMLAPLHECPQCDKSVYCYWRCPKLAELEDGDMNGPSAVGCASASALASVSRARDGLLPTRVFCE